MSSYHGILIHVVFSTKYRKPILDVAWRDELYAYIGGAIKDHEATLLKSGGIADHVHLLIRAHPSYAIASTIQMLKANSSKWINDNQKTKREFSWQPGYGAFSVSQSNSETVKQYIASQEEHHRKLTFQEEFIAILKKHGIEYDPRYVFESEIVG